MSIIPRLNISSQKDNLIRQLNITTLEKSYTAQYIDKQPTNCVETIRRFLAKIWLPIANLTGWKAGNADGVASLKAERAAIKNYNSKLDDLVAHMAKNPITNGDLADFLRVTAEPATSIKNPNNTRSRVAAQLHPKIEAFYEALKGRVVQLKTIQGANAHTIDQQASLFQAGLQEISKRIEKHNSARFDRGFIENGYDKYAERHIKDVAFSTLAEQITPDHIKENGSEPFADALDLYLKTFGFEKTKKETFKDFVASVREQVIETHGKSCRDLQSSIDTDGHFDARKAALTVSLPEKVKVAQTKVDALSEEILRIQAQRRVHQEAVKKAKSDLTLLESQKTALFETSEGIEDKIKELIENNPNLKAQLTFNLTKREGVSNAEQEALDAEEVLKIFSKLKAVLKDNNDTSEWLEKIDHLIGFLTRYAVDAPSFLNNQEMANAQVAASQALIEKTAELLEEADNNLDNLTKQINNIDAVVRNENTQQFHHLGLFVPNSRVDDTQFFNMVSPRLLNRTVEPQVHLSRTKGGTYATGSLKDLEPVNLPNENNNAVNQQEADEWNPGNAVPYENNHANMPTENSGALDAQEVNFEVEE